ncbi:PKD domain-containing protein [Chitinophaga skermanii]|uniref:PKD domain-containing protein n=1 Tax=Chitinophaga skermanii TaxID=331697 RepID=A0A327R2A8_9BACT|nr:PKD domain-containing protein [Chitinophaga skermanii]RAJ10979.1 PKD domain-containing protein [Chitinophaga skermanii]
MYYRWLLFTFCMLGCAFTFRVAAQSAPPVHDSIPAEMDVQQDENKVQIQAKLRPLRQIAGAPAAFYTYFWEFGDGKFSFDMTPLHTYRDTGEYNLRLYATNNYDDGKAPTSKPRRVKVKKKTYVASNGHQSNFFKTQGSIEMKINRMPRPGEEMVTIIGYRNQAPNGSGDMNGALVLFYNEKQFKTNSFDLADTRTYHGERNFSADSMFAMLANDNDYQLAGTYTRSGPHALPNVDPTRKAAFAQIIAEKQQTFKAQHIWRVENLAAGEEQFMFLSMNTLPEMIKDTNAVVTFSGMFVPEDPAKPIEQFDLEMQIVASHDPNKMQLKHRWMNYRFVSKSKELTYKVQFQNTGKGPAKTVSVGVRVPGMLSSNTVELVDYSPKCVLCDSAYDRQSCLDTIIRKDSIFFVFKNIYLPGMQQDGVSDSDSTKGFIKYRVRFNKELKKLPFYSQAAIVFDKNEPVITNRSYGRFKPGISIAPIAGYNILTGNESKDTLSPTVQRRQVTLGVAVAPFAPYRLYWQVEAYLNVHNKTQELTSVDNQRRDTAVGDRKYMVRSREHYTIREVASLDVVPVHVRYNLNRFVGVGIGAMATASISNKVSTKQIAYLLDAQDGSEHQFQSATPSKSDGFDIWGAAMFADVNVGLVRVGPSVGFRYIRYLQEPTNKFFIYGIWRF